MKKTRHEYENAREERVTRHDGGAILLRVHTRLLCLSDNVVGFVAFFEIEELLGNRLLKK
jgi:hypothetical protein